VNRSTAPLIVGEPADLRLVVPAAAAWAAANRALGWSAGVGLVVAAVLGAGAIGSAWVTLRPVKGRAVRRGAPAWQRVAAAALVCAAGSCAAAAWRMAALHRGPLPALAATRAKVTLEFVVTSDPRAVEVRLPHGGRHPIEVFSAKAVRVTTADGAVTAVASPIFVLAAGTAWPALQPSQHVVASGRLGEPLPGEFETAAFDTSAAPVAVGPAAPMQRLAERVRADLRAAAAPLPAGPRGLLPGLVDGDVSALPAGVAADFKTTGLTHIVAVSGANVAIVLGVVLGVARRAGLRRRGQAMTAMLAIAAFVVVARPQASVLRAAAMGAVAVLALAVGRRRRALPALAAAVLTLVDVDPTLSRSVGFALSVLATAALLVAAPPLAVLLARWWPGWLADAVAVPFAATLACSPLIAAISGRVSLIAVPANLLAEPAVAPATVCGAVVAVLAPIWPAAARPVAWIGAVPCAWQVAVAHLFARVPAAAVSWPSGTAGAVALSAVLACAGCGCALLAVRARRAAGHGMLPHMPSTPPEPFSLQRAVAGRRG
jgi:competence protein ComEC